MTAPNNTTTAEKIRLFRRFFDGLLNVYGTYDPVTGRVHQVKQMVTDQVVLRHLQGRQPYGAYLLVQDRTRAVVVDFDTPDLMPPLDFVTAARGYGLPAYIERSKSKGYHVWMFLDESGIPAWKARCVVRHILQEIDQLDVEIFPKQDALNTNLSYGNFINLPLWGLGVRHGRTVFLRPDDPSRAHPNQWEFLARAERVPDSLLDDIIEVNEIRQPPNPPSVGAPSAIGRSGRTQGLLPCARRMLAEGVSVQQRVACFRLAVHLKLTGLPQDLALAALQAWAGKNHPPDGKRIITAEEITAQVAGAYRRDYRSVGCEDPAVRRFCDPACPLKTSTSGHPQSVQTLDEQSSQKSAVSDDVRTAAAVTGPRR